MTEAKKTLTNSGGVASKTSVCTYKIQKILTNAFDAAVLTTAYTFKIQKTIRVIVGGS